MNDFDVLSNVIAQWANNESSVPFKVGDTVKVVPHPSGNNMNYQFSNEWVVHMDNYVGQQLIVVSTYDDCALLECWYVFPYESLVKV